MATAIDIAVTTTTYNVSITAEPNEYIVNITTNGGSGIESVTGTTVDNTDPLNPIVEVPNLAQVLAIDNKTNDIPIVSNNGNGYLYVNDETTILGNDFGGIKKITISEDTFRFDTTVRFDFESKGINLNTTSDGLGIPRLTTAQMNAIVLPTNGMIVWNTTESATYQYNGATWNALIEAIPTAAIDRGTFSGEFALSNAVRGGEYTPLTQTGALTLSIGASAVNGGIDTVLLTANGSAISGFSTWKKLSSDSISTTAATVMFIMVRQYQGVIYYTVNIIT